MQSAAGDGPEAAEAGFPELSADKWEAVAEQVGGADGGTWRGLLRGVCRAARDGVEGATTTAEGGRRVDLRVMAARLELLHWAEGQGCGMVNDERVLRAVVEGGRLDVLQWGARCGRWALTNRSICAWAAGAGQLEVLQWQGNRDVPGPPGLGEGPRLPLERVDVHWGSQGWASAGAAVGQATWVSMELVNLRWGSQEGAPGHIAACLEQAEDGEHAAVAEWIEQQV
eukprot:jgi/Tetstr1/437397/TSEL_026080.t1